MLTSVELFVGAGGLALGVSSAFRPVAAVERDRDARATIRLNRERGVVDWPLIESDVRDVDFTPFRGAALVAGGPPCQPFSIGGKHRGHRDDRNLFPELARAVREIRPQAFLVENVKGLARPSFSRYFNYILLQLTYPEVTFKPADSWERRLSRLERIHTKGTHHGLRYHVVFRVLNAADYGVPQKRERVFIVGFRSDVGRGWAFPPPTHSHDALLHSQWVSGDYWERHRIPKKNRPSFPPASARRVETLRLFAPPDPPWRTVRDAIHDLPDPEREPTGAFHNHRHNLGARIYKGHTGSPLDQPAKTLKAGDHGVPGGENMVAFTHTRTTLFELRRAA